MRGRGWRGARAGCGGGRRAGRRRQPRAPADGRRQRRRRGGPVARARGGRAVPNGLLAELADELVTVHGQSDQQRLRSPAAPAGGTGPVRRGGAPRVPRALPAAWAARSVEPSCTDWSNRRGPGPGGRAPAAGAGRDRAGRPAAGRGRTPSRRSRSGSRTRRTCVGRAGAHAALAGEDGADEGARRSARSACAPGCSSRGTHDEALARSPPGVGEVRVPASTTSPRTWPRMPRT